MTEAKSDMSICPISDPAASLRLGTSLMGIQKFFVSHARLTLFALTVLTWGPLLYNTDGIYWDDWVLVTQPVNEVGRLFLALGAWFSAFMHVALLSMGNGIVGYRIACFLATAVIAIATFEILLRTVFRRADALLVAALALVFPVCDPLELESAGSRARAFTLRSSEHSRAWSANSHRHMHIT
jgi:hypothetical protein